MKNAEVQDVGINLEFFGDRLSLIFEVLGGRYAIVFLVSGGSTDALCGRRYWGRREGGIGEVFELRNGV